MIEPISFLDGVSGYVRKSTNGAADKGIRLATIDPAYDAFDPPYPDGIPLPKVTFEGEATLSGKTYAVASGYVPSPGARVWMVPIGNTWLIAGAAQHYSAQGFYSNPAASTVGVEFGDGSYYDTTSGLTLLGDADIAGDLSVGGIGKVTYKRKTSATSRASTATNAADPEMWNVPIGVGTWLLEAYLLFTGTTGDFQGQWVFTGTYNGIKGVQGPSSATELQDHANTLMRTSGHQFGTAIAYGVNNAGTYTLAVERGIANVTVAGAWGYSWSQQTSDVAATVLREGSFLRAERVA
jgi:hypothetical protein